MALRAGATGCSCCRPRRRQPAALPLAAALLLSLLVDRAASNAAIMCDPPLRLPPSLPLSLAPSLLRYVAMGV
eukprot:COSAG02_NODE_357_length_23913_cov_6.793483_7_plen_73_part_00